MKAWVSSVCAAVLAASFSLAAAPSPPSEEPSEDYVKPGERPPSSQWRREDRQRMKPGGRCRSEADAKATAEDFCEGQLQCSSMSPPKAVSCTGQPGRWVCTCV